MSGPHGLLKQIARLGLLLIAVVSMNSEAGFLGFGGDSWKEEVLLHDGQKIIVKRSQSNGGRHEVGQPSPIKEHTITFELPGTDKTITFKSEFSEDVGRANFNLLALHILNGTPYIVAEPNLCLSYNKWGRPNPPYIFFKYEGKEWKRIPLSEFPAEFKTVNLDFGMPWDVRDREVKYDKGDLLTAETIKRHNAQSGHQYSTILREALPGATGGCMEEIRTGDGWMSVDWFSSQKTFEACLELCKRKNVTAQNCPCNKLFKGAK